MAIFRLDGKTALVTGAGSGIGEAIAHCLAGQGATVWIIDRDQAAARSVQAAVRAAGGKAEAAVADVSDPAAVNALAGSIPTLDILVNNAGIGHVGNLLGTEAADLDRMHAVNVRGPFNFCKAFVPGMLKRRRGSVISLASIGGIVAVRERLAYTISKFAVVGLTKSLALDHSHEGVRFNCICPGRVETPFVKKRIAEYPDPEKAYREMASTQLNGRMAKPAEIAAAALYLAADESEMVTGSSLLIDGGWSAGK
ncbi:MAG TPA: SDR family oxidoreductase [Opitutaceae bacterium]|jgi:NAD(P)-dependent dehydrogenase (short-subunit alcohol dehydrogenase family)